ncbi:uncharacterized protein LOC143146107 [Ptiloglossa arizonensis]|uniref:uncharacterized protein LOC143146107 n=1 Tax=Ptiloglossa arizonensis TaxID=3350558 RepID=UPI003FA01968
MTNYDDVDGCEKNVKIFVRIFPHERACPSCTRMDVERKRIYVRCLQELLPNRIALPRQPSYRCFKTDGIFVDSTQEEVYRVSTEDLVSKILDGVSCVVIGHGQTGSGKSFTITGLQNSWEVYGSGVWRSNPSVVHGDYVPLLKMAGTSSAGKENCSKTVSDISMANLTNSQLEQYLSYIGGKRPIVHRATRSINLLKILGNAFSVSSVIRFISHIRITREDLDITLSTLRFTANIAKLKPVKMKKDVKHRPDLLVLRLQEEIDSLKKELMINDLFLRQETLTNISQSRAKQIERSVLNFLGGTISDFTLFSVSQAEVLLRSIMDLYNRLRHSFCT